MSKCRLSFYDFFTIALFLLEDFFMRGRFGYALIYLIPTLIGGSFLLSLLHRQWRIASGYLLIVGYGALGSTFFQILANIIMATFLLLGTRGSRFLPFLRSRRGKSGLQTGRMPYEDHY
jgi:hypothetical protein